MAASPYCFAKKLVDVRSLDPPKYCYNLDAHECERRDDEGAVHNVCFGSPTNEGDDDSSAQLIRFQDTHTLIISHSLASLCVWGGVSVRATIDYASMRVDALG